MPACATACPTESIIFGEVNEQRDVAARRLATLRTRGLEDAELNDASDTSVGSTRAMFIFRGRPEEYNLPSAPEAPTIHLRAGWTSALLAAGMMVLGTALAFAPRPARSD